MIKNRVHIILLVVFQLMVFVAPHILKAAHHHDLQQPKTPPHGNESSIGKAAVWCPVCKFEFVTSIVEDEIRFCLFQPEVLIKNAELVQQVFKPVFEFCLLRGPPIS